MEYICADPSICMLEILEKIHDEEIPKFGLSSSNSEKDGYSISFWYGVFFSIKGVDLLFDIHDDPEQTLNVLLMKA